MRYFIFSFSFNFILFIITISCGSFLERMEITLATDFCWLSHVVLKLSSGTDPEILYSVDQFFFLVERVGQFYITFHF